MLYISDTEAANTRRPAAEPKPPPPCSVAWELCSDGSLTSSMLAISSQSQHHCNNNSSGWPSLINIASAASLLSSYTPPQLLPRPHGSLGASCVLSPIDDVDELVICDAHVLPRPSGRLVDAEREKAATEHKPVLGNAPFVFRMPPAATTGTDGAAHTMDWEAPQPAVRSTDNNPISPNAVRKTAARRQHQQQQQEARDDSFARIHDSPMVGDRRFNRRRQQQLRRRNRRQLRDEPTNGWVTDSESATSDAASDASAASRARTADSRSSCGSRAAGSRARAGDGSTPGSAGRRGKRSGRSRREWRVSEGVDRVLALMGTRVEEPTMVERLQMHRDIPYVISGYLQLGFNVFMVGTVLMVVVNVLLTIQRDVNAKVQEYSAEILQGISSCSKQYLDNRCDPLLRVPAMEQACREWENCMHRDPTTVGRARVSAETLAEIVNGFIEPISLKTMLFFVLMFFGTLFVSNFAFGAYRHSRVHMQHVMQSGSRDDPPTIRYAPHQQQRHRTDDPLASPSPRPPGPLAMLVPPSPSTRTTRRDRSAHSVDRRRTPHR